MSWAMGIIITVIVGVIIGVFTYIMNKFKNMGRQEVENEIHEDAEKRTRATNSILRKAIPTGQRLIDSIKRRSGVGNVREED
jgi:uncharacterized membrane-anchored protein YhcB (DUF1043 family)